MRGRDVWFPLLMAIAVAALVFPMLWSRDFGNLLILVTLVLPVLGVICFALLIWAGITKIPKRRPMILAALASIPCSLAIVYLATGYFRDEIGFAAWSLSHRAALEKFAAKDGDLLRWDIWGIAGSDNYSYLVSDHSDSLTDVKAASRWAHSHHYACDVAHVERMQRGLYILTTYNCPLG